MKSNSYSGFFKFSVKERAEEVAEFCALTSEKQAILKKADFLDVDKADHMTENVIGRFILPMGVGINFVINGKDYTIPMVTEGSSAMAIYSDAVKIARPGSGLTADCTGSVTISQIQLLNVPAPFYAKGKILENKKKIAKICSTKDPMLMKLGGGMKDVEARVPDPLVGPTVAVHLLVDIGNTMGTNTVNIAAEAVVPSLEELTDGRVELRILSNLADHRIARARAAFKKDIVGREKVVGKIITTYVFVTVDPYRAVTNNKGIMSGTIPAVITTNNDTRAVGSGAHVYAAHSGQYFPFAAWEKNADGDLVGSIEMPVAADPMGNATKIHPTAKVAVEMLSVKTVEELAQTTAAVDLTQNMAATRALTTEDIRRGHMSLHARNLAAAVGTAGELLERAVKQMVSEKNVRLEHAQELIKQYQK